MEELRQMLSEFFDDMKGTRLLAAENHLSLLAASVAFFSLFSLCPLLILCFIGSRFILRNMSSISDSPEELGHFLNSLMPSLEPSVTQGLVSILKENALSNVFNIVLLGWSAYQLFGAIHFAFVKISARGVDRNRFWANFVSLICFLIVVGASAVFLVASTTDAALLKVIFQKYLSHVELKWINVLSAIVALLCVVSSITLIYKIMPTQKVTWIHALRGSLLFLVLFMLGRMLYQTYATYYRYANAGTYGPFFTLIMVVAWIYFLSRIFLFAAQYSIYLEEK